MFGLSLVTLIICRGFSASIGLQETRRIDETFDKTSCDQRLEFCPQYMSEIFPDVYTHRIIVPRADSVIDISVSLGYLIYPVNPG